MASTVGTVALNGAKTDRPRPTQHWPAESMVDRSQTVRDLHRGSTAGVELVDIENRAPDGPQVLRRNIHKGGARLVVRGQTSRLRHGR